MYTIGYMCKEGDTKVYGGIGKDGFEWSQDKINKAVSDWTSTQGNIIIDRTSVEKWDCFCDYDLLCVQDGAVVLDEAAYVSAKQIELKNDLAKYRWTITHDTTDGEPGPISYCGSTPIFHTMDARGRLDISANSAIRKTYTDTDTFRFKNVDGTWSDVLIKDMVGWPEMLTETEQRFFENEETVQIAIDALTKKAQVDSYDVEEELDKLVKPILSADLTTYSYPIKYYSIDNP